MFLLFWLPQCTHPRLGFIYRRSGHWKGELQLPRGERPAFRLSGRRKGPDSQAVDQLLQTSDLLQQNAALITRTLFKDYMIWVQDCEDLHISPESLLTLRNEAGTITDPNEIHRYARLEDILVEMGGSELLVQLTYSCQWQIYGRLSISFRNGAWISTTHTAEGMRSDA